MVDSSRMGYCTRSSDNWCGCDLVGFVSCDLSATSAEGMIGETRMEVEQDTVVCRTFK